MKKRRTIYIAILCAVIVFGIGYYSYKNYLENKTYDSYVTQSSREKDREIAYDYYPYASGILCYTEDGISYIKGGKEIWNHAHEMKNPVIDICGDYVAIGDFKSNEIHLYGIDGSSKVIPTKYALINVEVSEQGVVAAMLENEEANYFQITDRDGNELVTGRTVLKGNGYPIDFSLSQDGKKMVVSYLYVSGGVSQSKVLFYNFSEIGQNATDRMVGGFNQYDSTIVPDVEFINNNTAVAFGDNMFTIYRMKEKPSIVEEKKLDERIKSIFYSRNYIGIVFESDDSQNAYKLRVYDSSGKNLYTKDIDSQYRELQFAEDYILKYNDTSCQLISQRDVIKFDYTFEMRIERMVPIGGRNRFVLISSDKIEEITLK